MLFTVRTKPMSKKKSTEYEVLEELALPAQAQPNPLTIAAERYKADCPFALSFQCTNEKIQS
jgi:hypothetical protein